MPAADHSAAQASAPPPLPASGPNAAGAAAGTPLPSAPPSTPGGASAPQTAALPAVVASSGPAAPVPAGPLRCRTVGPFDDLNAANVVADRLRSRGFNPRDRAADTTNPNVYWVYIGELTTEMQRRAIQTLNAAGIHDAVPMTQPEQSDRVSVGVFADQAHAVRRAEQVRALGLKPTLGLRQRNVSAHWIDFDLKPSDSEPSTSELIGVMSHTSIGLGPVKVADCPSGSG